MQPGVEQQTRKATRFGVKQRLYLAFAGAAALTVLASGVAWFSNQNVQRGFDTVVQQHVPEMTTALQLQAESASLSATAPKLAGAPSEEAREQAMAELEQRSGKIAELLDTLAADKVTTDTIRANVTQLRDSLTALNESVTKQLAAEEKLNQAAERLDSAHAEIIQKLKPIVFHANRDIRGGTRKASRESQTELNQLVEQGVGTLQRLLTLRSDATTVMSLMVKASHTEVTARLGGITMNLDKPVTRMRDTLKALPDAIADDQLTIVANLFLNYATGEDNVFELRRHVLEDGDAAARSTLASAMRSADSAYSQIVDSLQPKIDKAGAGMVSEVDRLARRTSDRFQGLVNNEMAALRTALEMQSAANHLHGLMATAANLNDPERIKKLRDAFFTDIGKLQTKAMNLGDGDAAKTIRANVDTLIELGEGEDNLFDLRLGHLQARRDGQAILERTREASDGLRGQVGTVVAEAQAGADQGTTKVAQAFERSEVLQAAIAGGSLLIALLIAWLYVGRSFGRRLDRLAESTRAVAAGDLHAEIDTRGHDEIAEMANALLVFRDGLAEAEEANRRAAEERERAEEQRRQEMLKLAENFEASVQQAVEKVASAAESMHDTAETMATTAEQTSHQSKTAARATETASSHVQTVAGASEELASSITEVSRQVQQSSEIAGKATERARHTNETVQGLQQAANNIGEVVNLIQDIAEQTNLLALNATIEAARAGDAGKGFAVVANEVKSLANQTAKATEDIAGQISNIQKVTGETVSAIGEIVRTIDEINEIAGGISAAVEQQTTATQEIADSAQKAATGAEEVSSNIAGVDQAAGETGSAANQVLTAAGELGELSRTLKSEVEGFLQHVRAA